MSEPTIHSEPTGEFELLDNLLIELESGDLDESQRAQLQELLKNSEQARKQYVHWQLLSAAMHLESAVGDLGEAVPSDVGASAPSKPKAKATSARFRWKALLSLAAGVAICLMAGRWAYLEWGDQANAKTAVVSNPSNDLLTAGASVEATSRGIAMLTRLVDAKWEDGTSPQVGTALSPGRVRLQNGYAQIEFFCGATVILEGPAEIELISSMAAKFHSGRLRAQVPPAARGFTIDVDDMQVVDLGTEFGLAVSPEGADVQVFVGEVELHRPDEAKQLVKAGEAVKSDNGTLQQTKTTPGKFVDLARLDSQAADQGTQRYQRWKTFSNQLRSDPRLIAYYSLDETQQWNRKLLNRALVATNGSIAPNGDQSGSETAASELDGAIVGASRVSGRWPSKDALEFKQPGDRVRVNIPGEFRSLTFSVWVKIDSLDRWYNSLFLTDNYQSGEPHWQILDTGQLFFSVRPTERSLDREEIEHREVLSPSFWNPSMSGKWLHLATTYDVDTKQTTHFLNGTPIHQEGIPDLQLVTTTRIGMASIGNWSMPTKDDDHFAIRNLNGSMDELAIFKAALSPAEIAEIYEHGKP
jgi:anti-sigma factor RsiW